MILIYKWIKQKVWHENRESGNNKKVYRGLFIMQKKERKEPEHGRKRK